VSFAGDRNREVDFVVRAGKSLVAIEVKSTRRRDTLPGMAALRTRSARRGSCWWVVMGSRSTRSSPARGALGGKEMKDPFGLSDVGRFRARRCPA